MYVNDGVCDCCDGSDEFDGSTLCPDECGLKALRQVEAQIQGLREQLNSAKLGS